MKMKWIKSAASLLLAAVFTLFAVTGCEIAAIPSESDSYSQTEQSDSSAFSLADVPAYSDAPYVAIHDNQPYFTPDEITDVSYESYAPLDSLGRCGVTMACIGQNLMPTEDIESISSVKPTGWHSVKYEHISGKYLYNRCHLIGYQLTGEGANKSNLITGTRYLNIEGMLPFENMTADYIKETGNHVMYRVTPVYEGENLVASGVLMEGYSVEDDGEGVCFCVFSYNVQPGVTIDYTTGDSRPGDPSAPPESREEEYILNTSSKKFHRPDCSGADKISKENRKKFVGTREELIRQGYSPCGQCKP